MRTLPLFIALLGGCSFSAATPANSDSPIVVDGPVNDTAVDARPIDARPIDAAPVGRVTGAQVQWKFNEGSGLTAADSAGLTPAYDLVRTSLLNSEWSNGGLTFTAASNARTVSMLTRPTTACLASKSATLEAWIVPKNETQGLPTQPSMPPRPAIIAGLTSSINSRSFEISQAGRHIIGRTRTMAPNALELQASDVVTAGALVHVALVQEQATQRLYINGVEKDSQISPLMSWEAYAMVVGGDTNLNAPWLGTARAVVLYCSALTAVQVQGNFAFGPTL